MQLQPLFKKTSTGKIQTWKIHTLASIIYSESGQVGGKMIKSMDRIENGKNIGKTNETTPRQQAELEAQARWEKKKKKGYVESEADAEADKVDETVITGGYVPMTAKVWQKHGKHIVFPCAVQPKLDGIRCTNSEGLFTRSRMPIVSMPHIVAALKKLGLSHYPLDGELYNHDYRDNFEEIVHLVKRPDVHPDHEKVEYHVYDADRPGFPFERRHEKLRQELEKAPACIKIVETKIAKDEKELTAIYEGFMDQGYEGAMVRNIDSVYENKKSKHLQKYKEFQDDEFKVIGIKEGRGKLAGHVGSFICEIDDHNGKRSFKAKAKGNIDNLKKFFEDESTWKNKMMTVQFQNYTKKTIVPRFGVGIRFRDDKDF